MTGENIGRMCRRILLVIHNCWLNGMANIFLHNSLDIFTKDNHGDSRGKLQKNQYQNEVANVELNNEQRNKILDDTGLSLGKEENEHHSDRNNLELSQKQTMVTNSSSYYKRKLSNQFKDFKNVDSR